MQHAACFVDRHFFSGIETADHRHFEPLAVLAVDHQRQSRTRCAFTDDVESFGAVDCERLAVDPRLKLQRQRAHADQIGAVDTLEAFGHDRFHACQAHAFGGPVTRRTLTVIGTGNDDQWLLAFHVGFNSFPHAGDLAFRFDAGQRAHFHLAIHHCHFVLQGRIGKSGALRGQVIATMRCVGVEVFLWQAHFRQIGTGSAIEHDGIRWRHVVGRDVVTQHRQRAHALERTFTGQSAFPVRRTADVSSLWAPFVQWADFLAIVCLLGKHRDVDLAELLGLHAGSDDGVDFFVRRPDVF